jgi:HAD superfamily hydrolase (TIGR01458 family)
VVTALKASGLPHCYVTNTTTRSVAALAADLREMGFEIDAARIISAPAAARDYLRRRGSPCCMLVLNEAVKSDFNEFLQSRTEAKAIVIGDIGEAWTYELLNRIFRLVMNGAELIALHRNRYWQADGGLKLDIGAFIAGLEYATGKTATLIGKPQREFFEAALRQIGVAASECAMIGDDIDSDVKGAQAAGMRGVLVRSGKYRHAHVQRSDITPDLVLDSFADLPVNESPAIPLPQLPL